MRTIDLICPGCGAHMKIDRNNRRVFCEYCGREMVVTDDSLMDREEFVRLTEEEFRLLREQEQAQALKDRELKERREMLKRAREEKKADEDLELKVLKVFVVASLTFMGLVLFILIAIGKLYF